MLCHSLHLLYNDTSTLSRLICPATVYSKIECGGIKTIMWTHCGIRRENVHVGEETEFYE